MPEDGFNSGARNVGRFFLYAIPLVLGVAASVWFGVYVGVHDFHHQLTQEERAAVYTGAKDRPTSKVAVEIVPLDCTHVTRADIDGTSLIIYSRNDCHETLTYMEWHWQEVSPNGIALHEGYTNYDCPIATNPGDIAECAFTDWRSLPDDDRMDKIRVWTRNSPH